MPTTVRATYANGVLTPLEPLDLTEGCEITVTFDNAIVEPEQAEFEPATEPSGGQSETLLEMVQRIREQYPDDEQRSLPTDSARNLKHYLYGHPKDPD